MLACVGPAGVRHSSMHHHEVFHALTVAAFTAHYIAISLAVY
ncbi:hypothetical protein [Streptomyces sp. NPDC005890]